MRIKDNPKLYWLRWVGVLPASICAYLLGYVATILFSLFVRYFGGHDNFEWVNRVVFPFFASGVAGYYYIIIGTEIAQKKKKIVASALSTLMILYMILCTIWAFANRDLVTGVEIVGTITGGYKGWIDMKVKPKPIVIEGEANQIEY